MKNSVLIVEDDPIIAMDMAMTLEDAGYRVVGPAGSVREALNLLEWDPPFAALLDINLGRELVTPVALRLKELGLPFAVCSAYLYPHHVAGPVVEGAALVPKPFDPTRLLKTLGILLG